MGTPQARWVLTATILASGMALLDGTVVNVALRAIGTDLDADLADLQWVVNAYMLTLASLILVAGSLGDLLGRRRVFLVGVVWFALASVLCGLAQDPLLLVVARALQGVGGALLTPGSLAILQASFQRDDRGRAIGAWAGLGGVAAAVGPFLGGWLVQEASWRWVFLLNVPVAVVVVAVTLRHVPESCDASVAGRHVDATGAVLGTLGLGGVTYALIAAGEGLTPTVWLVGAAGQLLAATFVGHQLRTRDPMVPPGLFGSRTFTATNLLTLVVYAALGALMFFLVLQLQVGLGWTPLEAGMSTLPITAVMLAFSSRAGALATRIGPRLPLTLGPLVCALGVLLLSGVDAGSAYVTGVLPGIGLFAVGLVVLVAPLTTTVLAAAPDHSVGVASGINNAIARTGSLLAVAALPVAVGLEGADYAVPAVFADGYRTALWLCAGLLVLGALAALVGLAGTDPRTLTAPDRPGVPARAGARGETAPAPPAEPHADLPHCPPLHRPAAEATRHR